MEKSRVLILVSALITLSPMSANADMIEIDFNYTIFGNPTSSIGQLYLALNGDGTISANLTSLMGPVELFALDSAFDNTTAPQDNFSPGNLNTPSNRLGKVTPQGSFSLGFGCYDLSSFPCVQSAIWSWQIGNVGQFSSAYDILNGSASIFDAYLRTADGFEAFGIARTVSVPEPGTLSLLALGLAGIGLARRKRLA